MQGDRIIFVKEEVIRKILADKFNVKIEQVQISHKPQGENEVINGVITLHRDQVKKYGQDMRNHKGESKV